MQFDADNDELSTTTRKRGRDDDNSTAADSQRAAWHMRSSGADSIVAAKREDCRELRPFAPNIECTALEQFFGKKKAHCGEESGGTEGAEDGSYIPGIVIPASSLGSSSTGSGSCSSAKNDQRRRARLFQGPLAITDRGSVFKGFCVMVEPPPHGGAGGVPSSWSEAQVEKVAKYLRRDRALAKATHLCCAFVPSLSVTATAVAGDEVRQAQPRGLDDGEAGAGAVLVRVLKRFLGTPTSPTLIFVARWYGGTLLGPARFRYFEEVAAAMLSLAVRHAATGTHTAGGTAAIGGVLTGQPQQQPLAVAPGAKRAKPKRTFIKPSSGGGSTLMTTGSTTCDDGTAKEEQRNDMSMPVPPNSGGGVPPIDAKESTDDETLFAATPFRPTLPCSYSCSRSSATNTVPCPCHCLCSTTNNEEEPIIIGDEDEDNGNSAVSNSQCGAPLSVPSTSTKAPKTAATYIDVDEGEF